MLSIQTNVNSLVAQQNLSVNNAFQSKTIQRLTSGYRINSSADDAAGLAVANKFRSQTAELSQGVRNANDGLSQLQIIDGGLTNISNILDRLKTLATESASTTFTGDRGTLNNEYQTLLGEIDRQASNVNLNTGGTAAVNQRVYIGGAGSANANAEVSVDLSAGAVDTKGLNLSASSVIGGGVGFKGDTQNLNDPNAVFLKSTTGGDKETFTFDYVDQNGVLQKNVQAQVLASANGYTGQQAVDAVNAALKSAGIQGITASIGSNGSLQFGGNVAFQVTEGATFTPVANSNSTTIVNGAARGATGNVFNSGVYTLESSFHDMTGASNDQFVSFSVGGDTFNVDIDKATTTAGAVATAINSATDASGNTLNQKGVYAFVDGAGKVVMTSSQAFTVNNSTVTDVGGLFTSTATAAAAGNQAVTAPVVAATVTGNSTSAIDAITKALSQLGVVQGKVGAGENQLNYAISLAQSQITNFDAAESQIRDTDVAAEAANLSKAQVLQQASIAAMAQANSAPQQVLSLLRG